uniref:Uncharacterized protein n=1 Tax=Anguilla anguilla TaxID=7936 RepID=A0A0E9VDG8_ANGAN
MLPLSSLSNSV